MNNFATARKGESFHLLRYPHGWFGGGIIWNVRTAPTVTVSGWQDNNFLLIEYE